MKIDRPIKLVVVEDSTTTRFLIKRGLEMEGNYEIVGMFSTGEDMLAALPGLEPDIVLIDIQLGEGMNGLEAGRILQQTHSIPILFTSVDDSTETLQKAMEISSWGFVLKPISLKELRISLDFAVYQSRVEKELRSRDHLMREILESIQTGIIQLDNQGRVNYLNHSAAQITGLGPGFSGGIITEVLQWEEAHTHTPWHVSDHFQAPASSGLHSRQTLRLRDASGRERFVSWELTPFRHLLESQSGWLLHLRDRTQEFEMTQNLEMAFTVMEGIEEGVLVTAPFQPGEDPVCVYCNPGFKRLSQIPDLLKGEAIGLGRSPVLTPETLAEISFAIHREGKFQQEIEVLRANRSRLYILWKSNRVESAHGFPVWVHTLSDITRMRELEIKFRQSQKLEAVGQLAGGIAHDFNNILSIINSYADLIQLNFDEKHPFHAYARNISESGRKGAAMVAQLMSFSRRQEGTGKNVINLVQTIQDNEDMLRRLIRESILVEFSYHTESAPLFSNEQMVEQVLLNLMVNAQDAISGHGRITITVEKTPCPKGPPGLGAEVAAPGTYVRLSVRDTGGGIPPEIRERIFEPFFTTKEVGKGTGLGLSTVFGLVHDHHGTIDLESEVGQGTCFHIYFPLYVGDPVAQTIDTPSETEIQQSPTLDPGRIRILVVEDDEQFSDCIQSLLELQGFEVYRASNGREALALDPTILRHINLMISDLIMPHMSGMDLGQEILRLNPEVKIIFMTGYSDVLPRKEDFPEDMVLLRKPFSISLIFEHLARLLEVPSAL